MSLFNNKLIIEGILREHPATRDDDNRLMFKVWGKFGATAETTLKEFATDVLDGKYPSFETIRRTRQKLQEHNPNLRGWRYEERTKHLEKKVRQEVFQWGKA